MSSEKKNNKFLTSLSRKLQRLSAAGSRVGETTIALHNLRLTQSFTLAFLDKYLKRANETLLDKGSRDPEAAVTRYGL
jgi:hypothetical protein